MMAPWLMKSDGTNSTSSTSSLTRSRPLSEGKKLLVLAARPCVLVRWSAGRVRLELADQFCCEVDVHDPKTEHLIDWLRRYAAKKPILWQDLPPFAPFQTKVYAALAQIPLGETLSYGEVAAAIGHPRAARAVGNACGANPIPLLIPCHRVIGGGGSLGGYSPDLSIKKELLNFETFSA